MGSLDTATPAPGLRERKKAQTRETIERVAIELFAERGFDKTTLADIAEAADISPRTIFSYFQSKEDILFCEEPRYMEMLDRALEQRPAGTTTVDALREFIGSLPPPDEYMLMRKDVITSNPELQLKLRARTGQFEDMLTRSIAKDLDAGPDDVRPALVAASMTAAFETVRDKLHGDAGSDHEAATRILDEVLEFLQGGLRALQQT